MKKLLWGSVLLAGLVFLAPAPTLALSCLEDSENVDFAIEHADAIFAGKLLSIDQKAAPSGGSFDGARGKAVFAVSTMWKGDVTDYMTVEAQLYSWGSFTPAFAAGKEYLVYAYYTEGKQSLAISVDCSRNPRLLTNAEEDLAVLGKGIAPAAPPRYVFERDLTIGSRGEDVIQLQSFLERSKFLVMPTGVSKGYFGILTRAALARYQQSVGIVPAAGYFGPITRAKFKEVIQPVLPPGQ